MIDLYYPELTAASLAKFTISALGLEHSPGCEKFESQNFKKIKFLRSYFTFVTYLPREVDERVISEIHFLEKKMSMKFLNSVEAGEYLRMVLLAFKSRSCSLQGNYL